MTATKKTAKSPARRPKRVEVYDDSHVGNEDLEEIRNGVEVVRTAEGRGFIVPRSLTKLRGDAMECAAELQRCAATIHEHQVDLANLVREARGLGVSWAGIGWCIGTSGEAVQMRWPD